MKTALSYIFSFISHFMLAWAFMYGWNIFLVSVGVPEIANIWVSLGIMLLVLFPGLNQWLYSLITQTKILDMDDEEREEYRKNKIRNMNFRSFVIVLVSVFSFGLMMIYSYLGGL